MWWSGHVTPCFHNCSTVWRLVVSSVPRCFTPGGRHPAASSIGGWVGPRIRSVGSLWRTENTACSCWELNSSSSVVQPVAQSLPIELTITHYSGLTFSFNSSSDECARLYSSHEHSNFPVASPFLLCRFDACVSHPMYVSRDTMFGSIERMKWQITMMQ